MRVGLRDAISGGSGIDEESGSIGQDKECRVPPTGGDVMDVQYAWSPWWEGCLCREETDDYYAQDPHRAPH